MILMINDDCINCRACAVVCPTGAILEPKKKLDENFHSPSNTEQHYYISIEQCNSCIDYEYFKCVEICPMDAVKVV